MVDIYQFFQQLLREKRDTGMTNMELAAVAACSHSKINALLNKDARDRFGRVEFRTIVNLFPEVFKELLKNYEQMAKKPHSASAIAINGNASVNGDAATTIVHSLDREKMLELLLEDDVMCEKCKLQSIRLLKESSK